MTTDQIRALLFRVHPHNTVNVNGIVIEPCWVGYDVTVQDTKLHYHTYSDIAEVITENHHTSLAVRLV